MSACKCVVVMMACVGSSAAVFVAKYTACGHLLCVCVLRGLCVYCAYVKCVYYGVCMYCFCWLYVLCMLCFLQGDCNLLVSSAVCLASALFA